MAEQPESRELFECGLVMPISDTPNYPAGHWTEVRKVIDEALAPKGFRARLVSEGDDVGVIHARIVQSLYRHDIVICDISSRNPNVMVELGLRLAFDKPTIIIRDEDVGRIFDIDPIEYVLYPKSLRHGPVQAFQEQLGAKVEKVYRDYKEGKFKTVFLGHFQITEAAKLTTVEAPALDVLLQKIDGVSADVSRLGATVSRLTGRSRMPRDDNDVASSNLRTLAFPALEKASHGRALDHMMEFQIKPSSVLRADPATTLYLEYDFSRQVGIVTTGVLDSILRHAIAGGFTAIWLPSSATLQRGPTGIS